MEIVGEPWIGKDGLEYVEVRQWNYEAGEFDYIAIPTTAFPTEEDEQ